MGKGHRRCEVCGIKEGHVENKSLLFSNFPLEPNRCREWLKAVGNEELVYLPIEKLHEQRNICANHFEKKDFNKKGNRLKRHAVPTLNLMALPLTDNQLADFPQHVSQRTEPKESVPPSTEHKENIQDVQTVLLPEAVPSTSQQIRSILVELSQNDILPEALPSTSQQRRSILEELSQNDLLSEAVPSTSQQTRSILVELSENEKICTKSSKRSGENIENITKLKKLSQEESTPVPEEAATTNRHNSQILGNTLNELTPREKRLMQQLQKTKCSLISLRRNANLIEKIDSSILKEIVTSAIKNQKRKPKGRRWTTKNKITALAIFKRSPNAYRYLQHLMPLPSTKTLHNVLKKIPMTTGINKTVIEHLKKVSNKKDIKDKYCGLLFDEIALKRRLLYDISTDKVEGYEDLGIESGRSSQLADHALVFMLQGVRAKFKQPLAFYFVKGTVSSQKLAFLIKDIISTVEETGFKIITTICDQGPTNMGAMKILKTTNIPFDQNENYFQCINRKIYIIYDVPHLFKSIRNNFLNYGEMSMCGIKAKWEHLLKAEEKNRNLLYLSKITSMHVKPKYRAKMRVKYAAQILSNTVAAVIKLMAQSQNDRQLSEEMMQTGTIIEDLDRLFDATNGPSCPDDIKKGRRENVSTKTDHIRAWVEYRAKLETVVFRNSNGIKAKNVRCIEGYITTLKSLRDIWMELQALGFQYLNLRQLNQDALENLFGIIRQHSPTNRNPTCYSFIAALKTSIISGMTAPHNRGSNCEKDFKKLLTDFHNEVFEDPQNTEELSNKNISEQVGLGDSIPESTSQQDVPVLSISEEFENVETNLAEMEHQPVVYVSGYIASSIVKLHNSCATCIKYLKIDDPDDDIYNYIKLREWWTDKKSLTYPTKNLCRLVEAATNIFENDVVPCLHYLNIFQLTMTIFFAKCDASYIECEEHGNKLKSLIFNRLALLLIRRQCQKINQNIIIQEETVADLNKKAQQAGVAK